MSFYKKKKGQWIQHIDLYLTGSGILPSIIPSTTSPIITRNHPVIPRVFPNTVSFAHEPPFIFGQGNAKPSCFYLVSRMTIRLILFLPRSPIKKMLSTRPHGSMPPLS